MCLQMKQKMETLSRNKKHALMYTMSAHIVMEIAKKRRYNADENNTK